jgi:hypothetical protein
LGALILLVGLKAYDAAARDGLSKKSGLSDAPSSADNHETRLSGERERAKLSEFMIAINEHE